MPKEKADKKVHKEKKEVKKIRKVRPETPAHLKSYGKKYRTAAEKIELGKQYGIEDALRLVKETSVTKFDSTVEMHSKINLDNFRSNVHLPHGTGKEKRVKIFAGPELTQMIADVQAGKIDFDVAVATPEAMKEIAKVARVLGPKGLMPSPKAGTVTNDPEKVAEELKAGKVEIKLDKGKVMHQAIGKASWDTAKLVENFNSLISALPLGKIRSLWLTSTMGPSVRVEVGNIKSKK